MHPSRPRRRRFVLALLALAVLAFGLRLSVSFSYPGHVYATEEPVEPEPEVVYLKRGVVELGDSQQYLLLAGNLRTRGAFSWNSEPNCFRTPGYPVLLALLGGNVTLVIVLQSVLGALAVFLTGQTGRLAFGEKAGLVAASFLALDVPSVFYAGLVMAETSLVFLLVLGTYLFLRRWYWLAGLVLGLAVLVKPIAVVVLFPLLAALVVRRSWKALAVFLVVFTVVPGLWLARNLWRFQRVGLTSLGGANMLYTHAAALRAAQKGIARDSARLELAAEFGTRIESDNPLEASAELTRVGLRLVGQDPLRYAWLHLLGLGWVITGVQSDNLVAAIAEPGPVARVFSVSRLARLSPAARAAVWGLGGLELAATIGMVVLAFASLLRRGRELKALLLAVGFCLMLAGGPMQDSRLRIPALPFLYLVGASALVALPASGRAGSMPGRQEG